MREQPPPRDATAEEIITVARGLWADDALRSTFARAGVEGELTDVDLDRLQ